MAKKKKDALTIKNRLLIDGKIQTQEGLAILLIVLANFFPTVVAENLVLVAGSVWALYKFYATDN